MKRVFQKPPERRKPVTVQLTDEERPSRPPRAAAPRSPAPGRPDRICFECDTSALSFLGRFGRELLLAARGVELPLSLLARKSYDHDETFPLPPFLAKLAERPPSGGTRLVCLPAFALPLSIEEGRYWALTGFDPGFLSQAEIRALKRPERLFVPSSRHASRLREIGIPADRITVLEPAVSPVVFHPAAAWPVDRLPRPKATVFIAILSPLRRQGIDLLLRAWIEEFKAGEPVHLLLKLSHLPRLKKKLPYEISDLARRLGALNRLFAPVTVLEGAWSDEALAGLIAGSDVLVAPDRLSFAGFRAREALCCGTPVIAPAAAGIDERIGYPVATARVTQAEGTLYPGSPALPLDEPDVADLRRRMREAFRETEGRNGRRDESLRRAAKLTDWESRARILLNIISGDRQAGR
ncbi:MAG TPA: glycosyltransferase family 4 protein [Candidatus Ozemobacteraceae bacterium]|nr:glycosyltransferase family 4 protein [Candidatus Ozemobacteraceae bacterium]